MGRRVEAGVQALSQTTLADFSPGEFLRAGLANMGDGAVSLLRAGLSGEWITTVVTAGLIPRWGHMAVYTASRLYVLGGLASSNDMIAGPSLVQSATVRSDHDLTSWVTVSTNLADFFPSGIAYGGAVVVNNFLYVIGIQTWIAVGPEAGGLPHGVLEGKIRGDREPQFGQAGDEDQEEGQQDRQLHDALGSPPPPYPSTHRPLPYPKGLLKRFIKLGLLSFLPPPNYIKKFSNRQ